MGLPAKGVFCRGKDIIYIAEKTDAPRRAGEAQNATADFKQEMKTVVIRHPRENRKKCSLRHLCGRSDFEFHNAADGFSFDATGYLVLEIGAPEISSADAGLPILLLDSTWLLLPKIKAKIRGNYVARSIPQCVKTAYPRKSKLAEDPSGGLATVEALFAALYFSGRPDFSVLDGYPFADDFLKINNF